MVSRRIIILMILKNYVQYKPIQKLTIRVFNPRTEYSHMVKHTIFSEQNDNGSVCTPRSASESYRLVF